MWLTRSALPAALIAGFSGFLFGFDAAVISGVTPLITRPLRLDAATIGFLVGAPSLANLVSSPFVGPLADRIGRKPVLIGLAFLFLISAAFASIAGDIASLTAARALGGVAFGCLIIAPLYISEISPPRHRGRLVSLNQLNIMIGFSVAYASNSLILRSGAPPLHAWHLMLGVQCLPAGILCICLFLIPESPRWLTAGGQQSEAMRSLAQLGSSGLADQSGAHPDLSPRNWTIRQQLHNLLDPRLHRMLLLGIVLAVAQQITGVNAIYFYAPSIFEQSGIGQDAAFSQAILIGLVNVTFSGVAILLIDRVGRKPLLLTGLAGVVLSMSLAAWGFHQVVPGSVDTANSRLILFAILGFVASFAVSLGPVVWVLLSEIFPLRVRGLAISAVTFFNNVVSFAVQFAFPWQLLHWGPAATLLVFAMWAIVALILLSRMLRETRGKSLEALEAELALPVG